jgi:hypothetical protein
MIIIGELINASRKAIGTAIESQDSNSIKKPQPGFYDSSYFKGTGRGDYQSFG